MHLIHVCVHACVYACVCVCIKHSGSKDILSKEKQNSFIHVYIFKFIYSCTHTYTHIYITYIQAVLGLHCCSWTLVVASRGYTLDVIHGLLTIVASFVAEHRF